MQYRKMVFGSGIQAMRSALESATPTRGATFARKLPRIVIPHPEHAMEAARAITAPDKFSTVIEERVDNQLSFNVMPNRSVEETRQTSKLASISHSRHSPSLPLPASPLGAATTATRTTPAIERLQVPATTSDWFIAICTGNLHRRRPAGIVE
jgi:hypothetical protein